MYENILSALFIKLLTYLLQVSVAFNQKYNLFLKGESMYYLKRSSMHVGGLPVVCESRD